MLLLGETNMFEVVVNVTEEAGADEAAVGADRQQVRVAAAADGDGDGRGQAAGLLRESHSSHVTRQVGVCFHTVTSRGCGCSCMPL